MRLHPDVSVTDTDDGCVLLQERTGRYWQLNVTGTRVLRSLLDGDSPGAVAADLVATYGIDQRQAEQDVDGVLAELRTAELTVAS
jgi:hypothetical protein